MLLETDPAAPEPCDVDTFEPCGRPISDCCEQSVACVGGFILNEVLCTDGCEEEPTERCSTLLSGGALPPGPCDVERFPVCSSDVGACCVRAILCVDGAISDETICDNDCQAPDPLPLGCEAYWMNPTPQTCSDPGFGSCARQYADLPCCIRHISCNSGRVLDTTECTDECAASCSLIRNERDCMAFSGCDWTHERCNPAADDD